MNGIVETEKKHYIRKELPQREAFFPGQKSMKHDPLCYPKNVYLPPLHIKLGLMKNFVKAMDNTPGFMYLKQKFPKISDVKIKKGIFVGPQIQSLMHDEKFTELLFQLEKSAWPAFKNVTQFFGKSKGGKLPYYCQRSYIIL